MQLEIGSLFDYQKEKKYFVAYPNESSPSSNLADLGCDLDEIGGTNKSFSCIRRFTKCRVAHSTIWNTFLVTEGEVSFFSKDR